MTTNIIGIVAGNFDVIHPGYVKLFEDAKNNACNYLIVALQGDPTIECDRPFATMDRHTCHRNVVKTFETN